MKKTTIKIQILTLFAIDPRCHQVLQRKEILLNKQEQERHFSFLLILNTKKIIFLDSLEELTRIEMMGVAQR